MEPSISELLTQSHAVRERLLDVARELHEHVAIARLLREETCDARARRLREAFVVVRPSKSPERDQA